MQFQRLFTQGASDPYALIHFKQPAMTPYGFDVPLEHPEGWSVTAVETLAEESACCALPPAKAAVEENTVPSWLWRQSRARIVGGMESSVRDIFDRVAGAAAYQGWKLDFFANEESARNFFDEARYMLAQRFIAIEPKYLATMGLSWAYGVEGIKQDAVTGKSAAVDISNAMIDAVVSGKRDRTILTKWNKIVGARLKAGCQTLRFSDTEAQWETPAEQMTGIRINLLAFRHNDGTVNIAALQQAVRIAILLIDLNEDSTVQALAVGYANLAPLLMALGLPYDSEAGRGSAAAISAIISAEAYAVSAELAGLRGASAEFAANRDACLRALRNHCRAAYGERNDYEKIAVTPLPLALSSCPDLALTAAARSGWDRALDSAQAHGLRHTQVSSLYAAPKLTLFMETETDGIAPLRFLTRAEDEESDRRLLHPSVTEALVRLGYDAKKIQNVTRHIAGALTLDKAPVINHASLRAKGLTPAVIAKIEAYLPQAKSLRHAVTPWIVGVDFCRTHLKISAAKLEDLRFNLLAHLGFSASDIADANSFCYGHDGIDSAQLVKVNHSAVFATASSLSAEASIRMAAAVQGFVSGEAALSLHLPLGLQAQRFEKLLLDAWRSAIKSLAVTFDANLVAEAPKALRPVARRSGRKIAPSAFLQVKAPSVSRRPARPSRQEPARIGSLAHAKAKSRSASKSH